MGTKVYFECNELVLEKNEIKKTYPVKELRYKMSCIYYKRPRGNIIDGRDSDNFLKLYHNGKLVTTLINTQVFLQDIINNYNLKIFVENDKKMSNAVLLKKPANLIFAHTLVFLAILMILFVFFVYNFFENDISGYLKKGLILICAILDIVFYKKSKYKIYYNDDKIQLRYFFSKKEYTYEQISEYNIYQSTMNNNMEMINISFEDDKVIVINQEYENYYHFLNLLKEKAFAPYV